MIATARPLAYLALGVALLAFGPSAASAEETGAAPDQEAAGGPAAESQSPPPDAPGVTTRDPSRKVHRNPALQAGGHRKPASDGSGSGPPEASPPKTYRNPAVRIGSQREGSDAASSEAASEDAPPRPQTPRRPSDEGADSESASDEAAPNPSLRRRPTAASDATHAGGAPDLAPIPPAPQRRPGGGRLPAETLSIEPAPVVVPPRVRRSGEGTDATAPADAAPSAPAARPARNWNQKPVAADAVPQPGDVVAVGKTGKKNLAVVKRLGGGSFGEVFVVEDRAGQLAILKQQKPLPLDPPMLGDPSYGGYVDRMKQARGKVLSQKQLVEKAAAHEVDMQNFTARALRQARGAGQDVGDFADEAELVGRGRIKQRYAGANFGELLKDVDGLTDDRLREASARVLLTRMLQAAAALDAVDVVHRDLHLGNIALDDAGRAKLLDFGLAKRKADRDVQLELSSGVGADGQYGQSMPPETRTAKNRLDTSFASSHKADVFSVGEVFKRTLDPERAFSPLVKSPRKELVDLVRELGADAPEDRPTAAEALARLTKMKTSDETAAEAEADTLLRGFAKLRAQKALAEPPAATAIADGSAQ